MEICGIHFAPLDVPLRRRLQTLAAAAWIFTMVFAGYVMLFCSIYMVLFTSYWWLIILYVIWYKTLDKATRETGGRRSEWVRGWTWWRYLRDYFPVNMEKTTSFQLDPKRNYMFCCFPHGLLCAGAFSAFSTNCSAFSHLFPYHKSYVMTVDPHFTMPFHRELCLLLGACVASARSIENLLSDERGGKVAVLMVGGASEALLSRPGTYKIIYNKRRGFIRCAMKSGSALVPVISFGETDLFDQVRNPEGSRLRSLQVWLKQYIGFAPAIPVGRGFFQYTFGLIPRRKPVTLVVGPPLEVPQLLNPSEEQISEVHEKFRERLVTLFEEQKGHYLKDAGNTFLEIS